MMKIISKDAIRWFKKGLLYWAIMLVYSVILVGGITFAVIGTGFDMNSPNLGASAFSLILWVVFFLIGLVVSGAVQEFVNKTIKNRRFNG